MLVILGYSQVVSSWSVIKLTSPVVEGGRERGGGDVA